MKILITSGGTRVPIDDVRYIGNMSTGRFGAELFEALDMSDFNAHQLLFLYAKGSVVPEDEVDLHFQGRIYHSKIEYKDYDDYLSKSVEISKNLRPDIIISAAAVSDYTMDKTDGKISSDGDELVIRLKKAPKVLPLLKKASPSSMVVGFKLLVSPDYEDVNKAVKKVLNGGADLVVYNDLTRIKQGLSKRLIFDKNMDCVVVQTAEELASAITQIYENRDLMIGEINYSVYNYKK